jgi:hypothetical protein
MAFFLPILILAGPTPDTIRERKKKKKNWGIQIVLNTQFHWLNDKKMMPRKSGLNLTHENNNRTASKLLGRSRNFLLWMRDYRSRSIECGQTRLCQTQPTFWAKNSVAGIHQCERRWVISGVRAADNDKSLSLGTREEASERLIILSSSSSCVHVNGSAPPSLMPSSNFEPIVGELLRKHQVINVVIIRVVLIITCLTIIDFFFFFNRSGQVKNLKTINFYFTSANYESSNPK